MTIDSQTLVVALLGVGVVALMTMNWFSHKKESAVLETFQVTTIVACLILGCIYLWMLLTGPDQP